MMNTKDTLSFKACVTWNHIRRGKRGNVNQCAVALACKEALKINFNKVRDARVIVCEVISVKIKDGMYEMITPMKAEKFIERFDDDSISKNDMKPFCFKLKLAKVHKVPERTV